MEHASDGLDTCALGHVTGLNVEGDGFLAVRLGPGLEHIKLDELHNGDHVWLFDRRGAWIGIVYAAKDLICSPIENDRPVETDGKTGWVHEDWIQILAG
ncbi:SH3 domain-containing protein [Maritalea sp. S77]|uniref:SH3 domain-containing protein n=1 Tax=Maritalea sp. S77 TaxID=3415125 RepID=UPI003C7CDCAA